jgi:RNA polymerase sigma-70 factor, ECF subfamily
MTTDVGDEELMLRTQRGNVHAFELLFERYRPRVFGFILRMLNGQRQEAEDLMQDIFIKLFKAREMYEPRSKFSTWLFAIVRNHCLNFLRSRAYLQAQRTLPLEPEAAAEATPTERSTGTGGSQASEEVSERLEQAILSLPEMYKDVFLLRAVEGFSHDETAQMLGLNPATVRTHFRRARLMLMERLEGRASPGSGNGGVKP